VIVPGSGCLLFGGTSSPGGGGGIGGGGLVDGGPSCFPVDGSAAFSNVAWEAYDASVELGPLVSPVTWDGVKFKSGPASHTV
jgi:hypothetical protein